MLNGIKHAHSGLRWIVLILLIVAIANAYKGWKNKQPYTPKDKKVHLFAMIAMHVQVLIGLISYYLNMGGKVNFSAMKGNEVIRFFTVEHLTFMLLAVIIMTIGFSKSKKMVETPKRFKIVFITYLIALLLVLAGIPWPFREALGGGWG